MFYQLLQRTEINPTMTKVKNLNLRIALKLNNNNNNEKEHLSIEQTFFPTELYEIDFHVEFSL